MATKYHVTFSVTPDTDDATARLAEIAESYGPMTIQEIIPYCTALEISCRLYRPQGYAGRVEADGNWVLE